MQWTINKLSRELNLSTDVVVNTYKAYWLYIRQTIESFPLKENLSKSELQSIRTNFNIPNLGKLVCTYDRYLGVKKRQKVIKEKYAKYKENKTNV